MTGSRVTHAEVMFMKRFGCGIFVIALVACGSSTNTTDSGGGGGGGGGAETKSGKVTCTFGEVCNASQYCDPEYSPTNGHTPCNPGCLADENCAGDQKCIVCGLEKDKYGQNSGVCRPASETKESVCSGGDGGSACARNSMFDQDCSGRQAFVCDTSTQPADSTCQNPNTLPGLWCCGAATSNPCTRDNSSDTPLCGGKAKTPHAYLCNPNVDPPSTCTESNAPSSGIYCCP